MKSFSKILDYLRPYKFRVIVYAFLVLFSTVFSLFSLTMMIPFLGVLFDSQPLVTESVAWDFSVSAIQHNLYHYLSLIINTQGKLHALILLSIFIAVMFFFKTTFQYTANYQLAWVRNNFIRDLRNKLFEKTISLHLAYLSEERKGDIMARMSNDVLEIEVSIIRAIVQVFRDPVTIIIYLTSLIFINSQLTLFVFILLPVSGGIIGVVGKSLRRKSRDTQNSLGDLFTVIEESLSGLRIIKAFNAESKIRDKFYKTNGYYTQLMIRMWRRKDMASPLSEFLGAVTVIGVMWFGGSLVLSGEGDLTAQSFIGYLIIFSQIINPMKSLSSAYYEMRKGMASIDRINVLLDAENPIKEKEKAMEVTEFKDSIEFKNVSFAYGESVVLKNINLKIAKGKTVALVGASGSGKSTIADLIPRFYDIQEGEILLDGIDIKDLKIKDLRNLFGIVSQESVLFNDTIFENIAFGVSEASMQEVENVSKMANAHSFIIETELQYDHLVGERGGKLSGGQKQRISIARALLKNPPILILDEATSALDTESEKLVQEAIAKLMLNRTTIVIAHRLSTIVNADLIVVLKNGEIVESGTHNDLIEQNGIYKKLYMLQNL